MRGDRRRGLRIVAAQELERPVGEDDAEAERCVVRVLLEHGDIGVRLPALDQVGEIKPCGAGTDDGNAHAAPPRFTRIQIVWL